MSASLRSIRSIRSIREGRFLVSSPDGPAARYAVEHLLAPHGRRERWLLALARRSGRPARAALAGGPPEAEGLREAAAVLDRLGRSGPSGAAAGTEAGSGPPAEWLLAGPRPEDRRGRFTAFLFPALPRGAAGGRPDRVVKLRRGSGADPGTGADLAAEAEALVALARELPEPLRQAVPEVLDHRAVDAAGSAWEVLELSVLPGRSAYVELQAALLPGRRVAEHLRAAGSWLARFHRATFRPTGAWSPPEWREIAPPDELEPPGWYRRLGAELEDSPWPLAAGHGDFWARNVLFSEPAAGGEPARAGPALPEAGRLAGVVDWEHFRPEAPPFEDLFHFAWTYGASFPWRGRRRGSEEAFRRTFLAETAVSREVRRYLAAYARDTGLDAGALGDLFRVFLLTREDRAECLTLYRMLEGAERSVFSG